MRTRKKWIGAVTGCVFAAAISLLGGCDDSASSTESPKPVVWISINPTSVVRGSTATVHWYTSGATTCLASGDWDGARPINGSEVVTTVNVGKMEYILNCTGAGGAASNSIKLTSFRAVSPP